MSAEAENARHMELMELHSIASLKMELEGYSRTDLLRVIQDLRITRDTHLDTVERQTAHLHRVNLHLEHIETLTKKHAGELRPDHPHRADVERAFKLAEKHEGELEEKPEKCPDCGGDLMHVGRGWWKCQGECGFRVATSDEEQAEA